MLQVFLRYQTYVRYLKWLTLALLSYVAVVFTIDVPWVQVLRELCCRSSRWTHDMLLIIVAVFGTTISPYLFFWQAAQEMEDLRAARGAHDADCARSRRQCATRAAAPHQAGTPRRHGLLQPDRLLHHPQHRGDAARRRHHGYPDLGAGRRGAASARRRLTFLLFSLGIIGTGLLAVPVLAGSAAYAVAESVRLARAAWT